MQIPFTKKNRGIKKTPLIFTLCVLLIYFFIFAYPLQKEERVEAKWVIDLDEPASAANAGAAGNASSVHAFTLGGEPGDYFGYFNAQGELILLKQIESRDNLPNRVTVSDQGFIYYGNTPSDLIFYDQRGEQKRIYRRPGPGFPLLTQNGERLFLFRTDLSGFKELNTQGEEIFDITLPSWCTSISYTDDLVFCGLGDGSVYLFDKQGSEISAFALQKSAVNCIYGTAISRGKPLVAGLAGARPQYLFVSEIREKEKSVPLLVPLDSDFRQEVRISFSPDGRLIFFEGQRAMEIFDISAKELIQIPLLGDIRSFSFEQESGFLAVASAQNDVYELLLLKPKAALYFRDYFSAQKLFLAAGDSHLFVGIDKRIVRYDVVEE
jgi:WD40 repeat protein